VDNCLVTGGFGFVGRFLVRMLVERGDRVTVFDRAGNSPYLDDIKDRFKVKLGDFENFVHVTEAVRENDIDTIYHVGALIPPRSEWDPSFCFGANVIGTYNFLEAARLFKVPNFIAASTQSTYSDGDQFIPDDFSQKPNTFYGTTKVCAERLGEAYRQHYGVNFRAARYCIVNGPGRGGVTPGMFVVWTMQRAALGKPFSVFVEPDVEVASIYVKDAAKVLIDLREADESRLTRRIYNSMSYTITARQVVDIAKKYVPDAKLRFKVHDGMMQKVRDLSLNRVMDLEPARRDFDYKPSYDLDATMRDYMAEVAAHRELIDQPLPQF
jgi:threonine 3-dehydrogenase